MILTIRATNTELTPALREYAEEKFQSVAKFFDHITAIDIDIGMRSHHHQKGSIFYAEANISVPGTMIRVEKDAEDLYKAIDKVKDHLKVELEAQKEKMLQKNKEEIRSSKEYSETE